MASSTKWEGLALANGRYLITAKLGEGGMGSVFRALDRNIEADVVIKIPHPTMMQDPEFAARFTREIRSLVRLSHPHIVKVSDVGAWDGIPFAVMQFLPGGSLEDRRSLGPSRQPLPCDPRKIPRWLEAVAGALDYVHAQGYVHRDVKPGNILFDAEGHAFLSDFGVAKVLASAAGQHPSHTAMTGTGMVLGTPEYMAPELIMGDPFDGRADQYALAVTVYELLCGRRPFEHETKTKILVLHTSKAPPRLTEWCPELPEPLSQAVLKGLSKDPSDRYPNCAALAGAVATTAARALAREGRVRLKCPQCNKTGGMAAADYAKLLDAGGRPSCPACKMPMELLGAGNIGPASGAQSGGTMAMRQSGDTGDFGLAEDPVAHRSTPGFTTRIGSGDQGSPRAAQAASSGTTPMSVPKNHAEEPTDPEPRPVAPRRGSQTMIERPLPQSDAKAPVAITPVDLSESRGLGAQAHLGLGDSRDAGAPHSNPIRTWIAIGASAVASLLGVTFLIVWLMPRGEANPTPTAVSSNAPPVAAAPISRPASTPVSPKPTANPGGDLDTTQSRLSQTAGKKAAVLPERSVPPDTDDKQELTDASPSAGGAAVTRRPAKKAAHDPAPPAERFIAAATIPERKPAPVNIPRYRFNPSILKMKANKTYSLSKVLSTPTSYRDQIVVPTGMFHLVRSQSDQVGGLRKVLATEQKMVSRKNNSLGMSSSPSVELEVEPKLAERLDGLGQKKLTDKVSILTLWFTTHADCVLVKVDILEEYFLGLRKATHYPEGDLDYKTLQVSPDGELVGKAPDEEWEQPGRMLHFARNYKGRVSMYKKMLQGQETSALQNIMGSMYKDMMDGVASRALQEQQLRRGVGGR